MTITKYGHSCLLVEENGTRILTDPGKYSAVPADLSGIDVILLTHEHADHTNPETIKTLLASNSAATVYTNRGVGEALKKEQIPFELLEDGATVTVGGVSIEAFGQEHAAILPDMPSVPNTCYLIAGRLFTPGDSLTIPSKPVEILALPIVAPWMKLIEAFDYAKAVHPKLVLPIHDGILTPDNPFRFMVESFLPNHGIPVKILELNEPITL